jgi:hypothetical protein
VRLAGDDDAANSGFCCGSAEWARRMFALSAAARRSLRNVIGIVAGLRMIPARPDKLRLAGMEGPIWVPAAFAAFAGPSIRDRD